MTISNAEFTLLQILHQHGSLSGYAINNVITQFGFREWADIGMTSIYNCLAKLEKKQLVVSSIDLKKTGKGPLPKKTKILASGKQVLKAEVNSILDSHLRGSRYKLALAALPILTQKEMFRGFQNRKTALVNHLSFLRKDKFPGQENLPNHVVWLFQHSFRTLETEIEFADQILEDLSDKMETK